tara:strand:+ start:315 stop:1301 length:987 start_codon:yes stop_codon:yes gene_type:complete
MNKWLLIFLTFLFISCGKEIANQNEIFQLDIPQGFPDPIIPEDNQLTYERIELGKRLFYDPILSKDGTISCESCHKQEYAFADNTAISAGVEGRLGFRNSMSLANMAYQGAFMREGGVPSLEMQVLVPIQDHNEMDYNILSVAEKLNLDSTYINASLRAYNRIPDAFVITRALASFQRTMLSGDSNYDRNLLNEKEENGKELFFSDELACSSCHGTFLFTNQTIENNGLYEVYEDSGKYRLTNLHEDIGKFEVPSLRNIEITAPYMHNGSISSLEEVIEHYASGGKNHFNKSELITGFSITDEEKDNLIVFLKSLTDENFTNNSFFDE